jgi:hypothetical protein
MNGFWKAMGQAAGLAFGSYLGFRLAQELDRYFTEKR